MKKTPRISRASSAARSAAASWRSGGYRGSGSSSSTSTRTGSSRGAPPSLGPGSTTSVRRHAATTWTTPSGSSWRALDSCGRRGGRCGRSASLSFWTTGRPTGTAASRATGSGTRSWGRGCATSGCSTAPEHCRRSGRGGWRWRGCSGTFGKRGPGRSGRGSFGRSKTSMATAMCPRSGAAIPASPRGSHRAGCVTEEGSCHPRRPPLSRPWGSNSTSSMPRGMRAFKSCWRLGKSSGT
mmetsp:Transcript_58038/g.184428  ORF Transcript_58038/g.184428 Transcript_58038/m.184428 type:complete len:239 (+) Transcript_58038:1238-1954(+)